MSGLLHAAIQEPRFLLVHCFASADGIILVCMIKGRSQEHSCSSSREEERESCSRISSFKLKMTQTLHIALSPTLHWPEFSQGLHLATSRLVSAVSTKAATCPDKNPIEEEGRYFAGQLSFFAMAFFHFTCLQTSKGLVLGLAVSLCQLLNWALVGGSLLNAIRPPGEIHLATWDP